MADPYLTGFVGPFLVLSFVDCVRFDLRFASPGYGSKKRQRGEAEAFSASR
jgi:hypothetical protein